ncbi:MAG: oxygen-independent coproporphyrinogen III oxidase [Clostridia bacterium]|nr:oxygen-independent coproporphyrinogen III oxidase [Clostridia bacterium]
MKEELGIYVHNPFCKQKCYYCDFVSFAKSEMWEEEYIEALKKEIQQNKEKAKGFMVSTIYIGGGTPSYIDSKAIVSVLDTIKENYEIQEEAEITIEVNPGTVTKEKLEDYKKVGINRLSIGLQSTDNAILKQIGRIHTYEEFLETYKLARKIGFTNINIDLMLALPNQTEEILGDSLQKVISLDPEHISLYSLILEEGTPMTSFVEEGKITLPTEEMERNMYWNTKRMLEQNGYIHYEISNFAKPTKQSKHNQNCWNQKQYLGFGLASHSYYHKTRYSNITNLKDYIQSIGNGPVSANKTQNIHEIQTPEDEQKEYMLLGLRKIQGIAISEFKNKFIQNPIYVFRKELDKLVKEELIEVDIDNIKLTDKGLDFANMVWKEFV